MQVARSLLRTDWTTFSSAEPLSNISDVSLEGDDNYLIWRLAVHGGEGTSWCGLVYDAHINFSRRHPFEPPAVYFPTTQRNRRNPTPPYVDATGRLRTEKLSHDKWLPTVDAVSVLKWIGELFSVDPPALSCGKGCHMDTLSSEAARQILRFLGPIDLCSVATTSKKMVCLGFDEALWATLYIADFGDTCEKQISSTDHSYQQLARVMCTRGEWWWAGARESYIREYEAIHCSSVDVDEANKAPIVDPQAPPPQKKIPVKSNKLSWEAFAIMEAQSASGSLRGAQASLARMTPMQAQVGGLQPLDHVNEQVRRFTVLEATLKTRIASLERIICWAPVAQSILQSQPNPKHRLDTHAAQEALNKLVAFTEGAWPPECTGAAVCDDTGVRPAEIGWPTLVDFRALTHAHEVHRNRTFRPFFKGQLIDVKDANDFWVSASVMNGRRRPPEGRSNVAYMQGGGGMIMPHHGGGLLPPYIDIDDGMQDGDGDGEGDEEVNMDQDEGSDVLSEHASDNEDVEVGSYSGSEHDADGGSSPLLANRADLREAKEARSRANNMGMQNKTAGSREPTESDDEHNMHNRNNNHTRRSAIPWQRTRLQAGRVPQNMNFLDVVRRSAGLSALGNSSSHSENRPWDALWMSMNHAQNINHHVIHFQHPHPNVNLQVQNVNLQQQQNVNLQQQNVNLQNQLPGVAIALDAAHANQFENQPAGAGQQNNIFANEQQNQNQFGHVHDELNHFLNLHLHALGINNPPVVHHPAAPNPNPNQNAAVLEAQQIALAQAQHPQPRPNSSASLQVHYTGCKDQFDAWFSPSSDRLAPYRSRSSRPKSLASMYVRELMEKSVAAMEVDPACVHVVLRCQWAGGVALKYVIPPDTHVAIVLRDFCSLLGINANNVGVIAADITGHVNVDLCQVKSREDVVLTSTVESFAQRTLDVVPLPSNNKRSSIAYQWDKLYGQKLPKPGDMFVATQIHGERWM